MSPPTTAPHPRRIRRRCLTGALVAAALSWTGAASHAQPSGGVAAPVHRHTHVVERDSPFSRFQVDAAWQQMPEKVYTGRRIQKLVFTGVR